MCAHHHHTHDVTNFVLDRFIDAMKNQESDAKVWGLYCQYCYLNRTTPEEGVTDGLYFAEQARNKKWMRKFVQMGGVDMNTGRQPFIGPD